MSDFLLQASRLDKRYGEGDHAVRVLEGLDLDVRPTERVAVIGESGVGKSTLLHVLGTLDRPNAGRVELAGRDLLSLPPKELAAVRNREIGFVFQLHHLLPDFSALENVMLPGLIARYRTERARAGAADMLERVGLSERLRHRPGELSGGEQQRVAVARALVLGPRLVLADEPTGNLDPQTGDSVLRLLLDLNRDLGVAMIVATHSEKLAAAMDRTLRLKDGVLTETSVADAGRENLRHDIERE